MTLEVSHPLVFGVATLAAAKTPSIVATLEVSQPEVLGFADVAVLNILLMSVTFDVSQPEVLGFAEPASSNILLMLVTFVVFHVLVSGTAWEANRNIELIFVTSEVSPPLTVVRLAQPIKAPERVFHPTVPSSVTDVRRDLEDDSIARASNRPDIVTVKVFDDP